MWKGAAPDGHALRVVRRQDRSELIRMFKGSCQVNQIDPKHVKVIDEAETAESIAVKAMTKVAGDFANGSISQEKLPEARPEAVASFGGEFLVRKRGTQKQLDVSAQGKKFKYTNKSVYDDAESCGSSCESPPTHGLWRLMSGGR